MFKKFKNNVTTLAIVPALALAHQVHSMDADGATCTMAPIEKKGDTKNPVLDLTLTFEYIIEKPAHSSYEPADVIKTEHGTHCITNHKTIIFKTEHKYSYQIRNLLKDGIVDYPAEVLEIKSFDLPVLTTDPEKFFQFKKCWKLVVLLAPRYLIEEKLETTAQSFKKIMADWKEDPDSFGIFVRSQDWNDINEYNSIINKDILDISMNSIFALWKENWFEYSVRWQQLDAYRSLNPLRISVC